MKRKRKELCPSPILEESPKRVKVQAQRKFAQNSGIHNGIITPLRDLGSADLPHASILPEPVELLPMKRPNTEDFLTFLCFRGTPILPTNLQFFNAASIVSDGEVHEIKGESSSRNGPIDIAKCAGSSEKPFIAFGVRKRADPIVISRQMDRKRRHALAIQALRRKYQEQKMAKIRALTISKLSEKTTNKPSRPTLLVKTNTIQKTETVTKKTQNTLQKTKVIATKHVKVTTRTLKTSGKPKMCLRSFRGKFVQKELPFRAIRSLADGKMVKNRPEIKNRTSRNSNKGSEPAQNSLKKTAKPLRVTKNIARKSDSKTAISASLTRKHMKRRILIPSTAVATMIKPKLRSTTTKKTVISRKKAQQRVGPSTSKSSNTVSDAKESSGRQSNDQSKKEAAKKPSPEKNNAKKSTEQDKKPPNSPDGSRRITRRDSELTGKNSALTSDSNKREITKNVEMKRQVKIAETDAKKVINKKLNLRKEFNLKSSTKEVKKNLDLQKTRDTTLEKKQSGQKVTRDVKTVEMTIKKIVTRKSEVDGDRSSSKDSKSDYQKTSNPKEKSSDKPDVKAKLIANDVSKKTPKTNTKPKEEQPKKLDNPKKNLKITKIASKKEELPNLETKEEKGEALTAATDLKVETVPVKKMQKNPLNEPIAKQEPPNMEDTTRRVTRDSAAKSSSKEPLKKSNESFKKDFSPVRKDKDQDFSKKINEIISNVLKDSDLGLDEDLSSKRKSEPGKNSNEATAKSRETKIVESSLKNDAVLKQPEKEELSAKKSLKSVDYKKSLASKFEPKKEGLTNKQKLQHQPENEELSDKKTLQSVDHKKPLEKKSAPKKEELMDKQKQHQPEKEELSVKKPLISVDHKPLENKTDPKNEELPSNQKQQQQAEKEELSTKNPLILLDHKKSLENKSNPKTVELTNKQKQHHQPEKEALSVKKPLKSVAVRKPGSPKPEEVCPLVDHSKAFGNKSDPRKEELSNNQKQQHKREKEDLSVNKPLKSVAANKPENPQPEEVYPLEDHSKALENKCDPKKEELTIKQKQQHQPEKEELSAKNPLKSVGHKSLENKSDSKKEELTNKQKQQHQPEKEELSAKKPLKSVDHKKHLENKPEAKKEELTNNQKQEQQPEKEELTAKKPLKSVDHKKPLENKPDAKKEELTNNRKQEHQPEKEVLSSKKPLKSVAAKKTENPKPEEVDPKKSLIPTNKKPLTNPKKDESPKRTRRGEAALPTSARPSRKTKEAAALYMEILSHKLVGDDIIDDDISIDSFPELPNVKRTEQREIELKAQAKTSGGPVEDKKVLKQVEESKNVAKASSGFTPEKTKHAAINTNSKNGDELDVKSSLGKRKSNPLTVASDDESDNEVLQAKIKKIDCKKDESNPKEEKSSMAEDNNLRRQTRHSSQQNKNSGTGDSSDESFHLDIRVPRKKKSTRSKNRPVAVPAVSVLEKNVDIILEAARVLEGKKPISPLEVVQSAKPIEAIPAPEVIEKPKPPKKKYKGYEIIEETDSDESTTSDINLKSLQTKQRNKKLSKTKCSKSSKAEFSDSDEEPLVKLTVKSIPDQEEPRKKEKTLLKKPAIKTAIQDAALEPKPKRECTKRPSNYLPMFSSSDEDDEPYFHGFNTTKEEINKPKVFVQALAPSLDLLSKDIGRKGKVNMSNEQIEQWLKDSALAGSCVAKENDAMLKFGEKIPTEVPKTDPMSEPEIKPELIPEEGSSKTLEVQPSTSKETSSDEKPSKAELRSPLGDRKWIFKKDKKELAPNKNAFSPENECSVYAFGEETEEIVSTPFRRPSRRPSSTATSRSEDEMTKNEEAVKQGQFRKPSLSDLEDSRCFNIPQNPTKVSKPTKSETMVPPSGFHPKRQAKTSLDRFPEPFDDCKYKIPSSPSASSGSSAKLYKKGAQKTKGKLWEPINSVYVSDFPKPTDPAKLVEAPVFHPTDQEFQDPLEYIERIRHKAEQFGICKIVPPSSFKPECKVSDDMRFTAFNQYVHKMLHRWGPNFKEFIAIRKYLATQSISLKTPPLIGGMEIDLPRLYQTVQSLGGLKEVIEKKKWSKVSDHMKIPKSAQDRVTKLDDIYCKYLLPYDTLSPAEREKLFDDVETCWAKRESRNLQEKLDQKVSEESIEPTDFDSDDNELDECTMKGKNMALNALYRIARNTMAVYFKASEPTALEAEQEFWRYVTQKQNHICVHSASIDCGTWGYGFAVSKNSPFAKHPWNLKVLSNNNGSVLRSLGPVMGVTIPTLHVGMVFSACCWYRDPHGLPWVEYLHTGGNKIWYGIPSSSCEVFHAAMQKLVPSYCRDKELWLPSDTAMVPPGMLLEHNVSLCRTIQEPGQFIVVFPKVFTSSISTGYVVSESVYFAPLHWLKTAKNLFTNLKTSCEPSMFSLEKLFVCIANDGRSSVEALRVILPFVEDLVTKENENRRRIRNFGEIEEEKITNVEPPTKKKKIQSVDGDFECEICRMNLYVSMVIDTQDDLIYCLEDALKLIEGNSKTVKNFKLTYSLGEEELNEIPKKINYMIDAKLQKKAPGKLAGLPTLLK